MRRWIIRSGLLIATLFIFSAPSRAQVFELTCPAGTTSVQLLQSINNVTGKIRQNYCIDNSGNVFENISGASSMTATDAITSASMFEPFKVNVNSANSQSIFQTFYSATAYDSAAVTGAMIVPSGSTKIQATSVIGLIDVASGAAGTAGVALGGYARATANNSHVFGLNSNASDCTIASCGFNTTSITVNGFEADCNALNAGSNCTNIIVAGVYNAGTLATGIVFGAPFGTKGVFDFGVNFQTHATPSPSASQAAIFYNPVATGASQVSQGEEFQSTFSDSTPNFASLNLSAAGNLTVGTNRTNSGFLAPMLTAGNALCTGAINGDICVSRSATTGATSYGSDGNVILFRNGSNTFQLIGASFLPSGAFDLGSTSLPWGRVFINTAPVGTASLSSLGFSSSRLAMNNNNSGSVNVGTTPLFTSNGTEQLGAPHIVQDTATLAAGTVTVTLTGSAVFTNATSYTCVADDDTAIAATRIIQNSGSSITIQGTGTDVVRFSCIGN